MNGIHLFVRMLEHAHQIAPWTVLMMLPGQVRTALPSVEIR